jgi:glycosyltransferase involved in cell wall biosynthesis
LNDSVAFLVEPNAQAMAQGILMALDSSGESKRRVANARKLYEQHYSRPVYVKKLEQLLESLS